MSDPRFAPTPEAGAAYRVLFEYFKPTECFSDDDLKRINEGILFTLAWAEKQDEAIQSAYQWGAAKVKLDAEDRMKIIQNSRTVAAAYNNLPKPPFLAR